ncbi:hypothetical protein B0H19DRAFT_1075640 [Mycena capillaripes]|nr:hypothetical protein B0H19DRAFT_1075640 [Mycena capillaripes]
MGASPFLTASASVKKGFNKFLKRANPHEIRDARALPTPAPANEGTDVDGPHASLPALEGLIPLPSDDDDDATGATQVAVAKPKRIRRKRPAATAVPTATTAPTAAPAAPAGLPTDPALALDFSVPENFDDVIASMASDYESTHESFGTSTNACTDDDQGGGFGGQDYSVADPNYDLHLLVEGYSQDDPSGDFHPIEPTQTTSTSRPAPRAIYQGAAFDKYRDVGTFDGWRFPRISELFNAFARTSAPSTTPSMFYNTPAAFTFGSVPSQTTTTAQISRVVTPISNRVVNATQEVSPPATTPTDAPAVIVAPSRPGAAAARASALSVFKSAVANATAAVQEEQATPPAVMSPASTVAIATAAVQQQQAASATPPTPSPEYSESRPPANLPKGHPLTPAAQKAAAAVAAKANKPAGKPRGRPRKVNVPSTTAEAATAIVQDAARAETDRINREALDQRKVSAEMRRRSKVMEEEAAARDAADTRERARVHNPAGDHDLFITGARPKRAVMVSKNPDGTDIIRPKKRTRTEITLEEDRRILDGLKKRKVETAPAAKKAKAKGKATRTTNLCGKEEGIHSGRRSGKRRKRRRGERAQRAKTPGGNALASLQEVGRRAGPRRGRGSGGIEGWEAEETPTRWVGEPGHGGGGEAAGAGKRQERGDAEGLKHLWWVRNLVKRPQLWHRRFLKRTAKAAQKE